MAGMLYSPWWPGLRADLQGLGRVQFCAGVPWCCSPRWPWPAFRVDSAHGPGLDNAMVANLLAFAAAGPVHVRRGLADRAPGAAPPGEPGRRDAADGHAGHHLLPDGLGQTIFGSDIYKIDVGMPKDPVFLFESMFEGRRLINKEDVIAALPSLRRWCGLPCSSRNQHRPRPARRGRRPPGRQSIGIPLNRIWVIVWCVAGIVALVAGMIWGSKLGVQFSLTTVALRPCRGHHGRPHLGAGAIIGGLIIGVGEKLSRSISAPWWAVASKSGLPMCWHWCSCCSAPGSVRREDHRPRLRPPQKDFQGMGSEPCSMFYRKRPVQDHLPRRPADLPDHAGPLVCHLALMAFGLRRRAMLADDYLFRAILIPFLILSLAALGVNILVGYCGQISLGSGAFMAVGPTWPSTPLCPHPGMPLIGLLSGGLCPRWSAFSAFPSLRVKGLYLAVATLAAQFFCDWAFLRIRWFTNNNPRARCRCPTCRCWAAASTAREKYLFCLLFLVVLACWPRTWCAAPSAASGWPSATWTWLPP